LSNARCCRTLAVVERSLLSNARCCRTLAVVEPITYRGKVRYSTPKAWTARAALRDHQQKKPSRGRPEAERGHSGGGSLAATLLMFVDGSRSPVVVCSLGFAECNPYENA
jgi:hypothetical protein